MKNRLNLDGYRQYLERIKKWILVVGVLGVIIIGYYSTLGIRYWNASKEIPELSAQSDSLLGVLRVEGREERTVELELDTHSRSLQSVKSLFTYEQADDLIDILASTSEQSAVTLTAITVGDKLPKVLGAIQYVTQPISVSVTAQPDTIFRWLELLYETVPVMGISSFRVSNLDSLPTARIDFVFFLSPVLLDGEQE